MARFAITLEMDAAPAEALSDALIEAGADSVALDPAGRSTRLTALASLQTDPAALVACAARASALAVPAFDVSRLEDEDWVRRAQSEFGPIRATGRLWIVPSWCEPPDPEATVVRLDPGLAFGTGSHPSTHLVLQFLDDILQGGERVLDYGCGSGILAIAAAKLGAGESAAVDTDPVALAVAVSNARANGVALQVSSPEALPAGTYDLVLANILARPLIDLAPLLAARTRPGGRVALSGVLDTQAAEVADAYAPRFEIGVTETEQGWSLLEGLRK